MRNGNIRRAKPSNIALIRRFIEACARADADEFANYFCDDAVWWNALGRPLSGAKASARPCAVVLNA